MVDNYYINVDWVRNEIGSLSSGKNLGELFSFEQIVYGGRLCSDSDDVQSLGEYLEKLTI